MQNKRESMQNEEEGVSNRGRSVKNKLTIALNPAFGSKRSVQPSRFWVMKVLEEPPSFAGIWMRRCVEREGKCAE
ncbi:hypothetical protein [Jeotgalibacillus aurantiacus]|uniref:hypothetical protein n=1 Tax=Jeotgalibacillus aurantiacus TaxID=2763266 RepID=UPI001D0AD70A|nr:hypothetical protein [Jeotgalibacillus aurantiacus]